VEAWMGWLMLGVSGYGAVITSRWEINSPTGRLTR
jgi:hypothetical protein